MELALDPHHRQTTGTSDRDTRLGQQAPSIGDFMMFESGQFAGRTIRVELQELQKAESGRKYAKVDRRPLDPPPAVLLRLYEADDTGGSWERELLYEDVLNVGLMCTVDLFPVPEEVYLRSPASQSSPDPLYMGAFGNSDGGEPSHSSNSSIYPQTRFPLTYFPLHPYTTVDTSSPTSGEHAASSSPPMPSSPPFQIPRRQLMLGHLHHNARPHDTIYQIGNHLVTESSKLTPALVGERFAEPTLIDYHGRKAFVFVFGDLAVRREGVFILRYRAFDIFSSVPGTPHAPVLAELYGGAFKVYSTREFPGLEPSTDLTRTLSKYGVRVTLRDAERKSKKRSSKDFD